MGTSRCGTLIVLVAISFSIGVSLVLFSVCE